MAKPPLSACFLGALLLATTMLPADPLITEPQWSALAGSRLRSAVPERPDTALLAVPTRLDQIGRVLVPVMLNGHGPFRFVVDTGASHSTISPRVAQALGLPLPTDALVTVNGITGTEEVPAVAIGQLQAGELVMHDTRLPVVAAPMLADSDGILGAAGLTSARFLVDFLHNSVVITRGHGPGAVADYARIPGKRVAGGLLMVWAMIGRVRVDAIIDTGSERSLGNLALRDVLHAKRPDEPAALLTPVYGATDTVSSGEMLTAPVIALGTARIAGLGVVFGDFHIFKVWALEARPALLLGMDALGTLDALAIDFDGDGGALYVRTRDMDTSGYNLRHLAAH